MLAAAAAGCDDENEFNDDLVNVAIDVGDARGEELAIMTDQELGPQPEDISTAMAAMIVMTIDQGEIATAQAALPNLIDAQVVEFANRMIDEHTSHLEQTQNLVADLGITPMDTAVAAGLRNDAEAAIRELQVAGTATDVVYMRTQVEMHSAALTVADALVDNVDGDFHDFLKDTRDMISDHRQDAIDLLRDL